MNIRESARRWLVREPGAEERRTAAQREFPAQARGACDAEYLDMVRAAWEQWQAAQNFFNSVSDPELVDYAIYDLEASRRKYVYMLKRAEM